MFRYRVKTQKTYKDNEQIRKKHLSNAAPKGMQHYFNIRLIKFLDNLRELVLVKNLCVLNEIMIQVTICG